MLFRSKRWLLGGPFLGAVFWWLCGGRVLIENPTTSEKVAMWWTLFGGYVVRSFIWKIYLLLKGGYVVDPFWWLFFGGYVVGGFVLKIDRLSVVWGWSVDLGGRMCFEKRNGLYNFLRQGGVWCRFMGCVNYCALQCVILLCIYIRSV